MSDVKLLAAWDGWCDPCATERPLVLVEIGPRGLRSWLHGVGAEDRTLSLTCRVCGQWQLVPQLEEDDEPVVDEAAEAVHPDELAETLISPVLASALILVRTAAFDETGRVVASTAVETAETAETAETVTRPRTEVHPLDEEPPAEEAVAVTARSRWFSRKPVEEPTEAPVAEVPAVEAAEVEITQETEPAAPRARWFSRKVAVEEIEEPVEAAPVAEVEAPVAEVSVADAPEVEDEDAEPAAPRARWFSRKVTVEAVEEIEEPLEAPVAEAPVAELATAETPAAVAEVETAAAEEAAPVAPRARWFTRRTTATAPAVTATTVTPAAEPVRAPRSIAPDVEEPVRPHKVNPAAVRPLPQTRAIPVPRTYRAPISAPSATDTAPLALLAAGYDVVAAGAR